MLGVTVAGCGGAKPLTRAQLVSHADALCTQVHAEMKKMGPAKTPHDLALVAKKLAGFEQQQLESMRKLKPPAAMSSDWKQMIEGAEDIAEDAGTISADVQLKKSNAAGEALKQIGSVEQHIAPIVERDHFTSCKQLI